MKSQYITLLRLAQNVPPSGSSAEIKRAHKEAKKVVSTALSVLADCHCKIGNNNLTHEVYGKVQNIVLCPSMIEGYCEYLNETLSRGL